ncbi:MAG: HAD family hydrolase [Candidatus Binatia bacterium]
MLRAIIFDFNGVLVNDEPIHLELFQKVLREEGITVSEKDYYERYLGMDDRGCFKAVYHDCGRQLSNPSLADLIQRKATYYRETIKNKVAVFPGVKQLVPFLASRFPLAIASGALKGEIKMILDHLDLRQYFRVIVSAEDVNEGKPHPEIFNKALSLINENQSDHPIQPLECLVIEDSKEGLEGAHRAGMKCLAVANSHPAKELNAAEAVVNGLNEVTETFLEQLLS